MVQELFRGPLLERLLARTPLVVVVVDPVRGAAIARRDGLPGRSEGGREGRAGRRPAHATPRTGRAIARNRQT